MGIDYGRGTSANRDPHNGIRYGIIPLGKLADWAFDEFTAEYDASCPRCGADIDPDDITDVCAECDREICSDEIYPDEPSRVVLAVDDYRGKLDSDNDVRIFRSPYYTIAGFASPCAPGAVCLTDPSPDAKAYCFGHDWFPDGVAPYPVYSVVTGERIPSPNVQAAYEDLRKLGIMTGGAS